MRVQIWCLVFTLGVAWANPLMTVMRRRFTFSEPMLHISNCLYIQTSYCMTTRFPVVLFPRPLLCVLPNAHFTEFLSEEAKNKTCLGVKRIIIDTNTTSSSTEILDLSLIEFMAGVQEVFGITMALFRFHPPPLTPNADSCVITHNMRNKNFKIYDTWTGETVTELRMYPLYITVSVHSDHKITVCPYDNGLPLRCNGHVVGLLSEVSGDYCSKVSVFDCAKKCRVLKPESEVQLRYTNLIHPSFFYLINSTGSNWIDEINFLDGGATSKNRPQEPEPKPNNTSDSHPPKNPDDKPSQTTPKESSSAPNGNPTTNNDIPKSPQKEPSPQNTTPKKSESTNTPDDEDDNKSTTKDGEGNPDKIHEREEKVVRLNSTQNTRLSQRVKAKS
ncbi:hypothetical protein TcasGA2_TC013183 [Tribolium castaneum]|uniref:Uncharacterized protein n=1 Tax=Tribolium castaneum TaxID=7070 RepID=D6WN18_TRICA|nr:hypothetical protein TcasGA2_TC013183 [Tribolium castaneum]